MFSVVCLALLAVVAAVPNGSWRPGLSPDCPRCVKARETRATAPAKLPNRAVVYSVVGEFATASEWRLIDLDAGRVTIVRTTKDDTTVGQLCTLAPGLLNEIRQGAVRMWRSKRPRRFVMPPPGAVVDTYVVSGSALVAYNPFQPEDEAFAQLVEKTSSSCPTEAA